MKPETLKTLLSRYHIYPKKGLGQYFLIDEKCVERIVTALELTEKDTILEVGGGVGALTFKILPHVKRLICVEIDLQLTRFLEKEVPEEFKERLYLVQEDILNYDLNTLPEGIKIVSNLPYFITSEFISYVLKSKLHFSIMVLTLQEEVALRITSRPGRKEYSFISVLTQFYTKPEFLFRIRKSKFCPVPDVDGGVVKFVPIERRLRCPEDFFFKVVSKAFSKRRKMLRNVLGLESVWDVYNLYGTKRAEELSVEDYIVLAEKLYEETQGIRGSEFGEEGDSSRVARGSCSVDRIS